MADLGDTLRFRSVLYDKPVEDGGVLVNAPTAVLTITLPDGTSATPAVTNPSTGRYACDYQTTTAGPVGRYVGTWLFTLAGGATTAYVESFDVGSSLVTIDEALAHLRAGSILTAADDLEQLQYLSFVATDAVERDLGRVLTARVVSDVFDGGELAIPLRRFPVPYWEGGRITVTSLTENGVALTGSDYIIRKTGWILQRGTNTSARCWAAGWDNIEITYSVSTPDPPRIARKVCLNAIQGMWQESQQAAHPAISDFADAAVFAAQGALTPIERDAYLSLMAPAIA